MAVICIKLSRQLMGGVINPISVFFMQQLASFDIVTYE